MDAKTVKAIADQWMISTPSGAYMAGLDNLPGHRERLRASKSSTRPANGTSILDQARWRPRSATTTRATSNW